MRRKALLGFALVALAVGKRRASSTAPGRRAGPRRRVPAARGDWARSSWRLPRGQIAAFNAACPCPGWNEMTDLQGRFIVGLVSGGTLAQSVGDALTNGELRLQDGSVPSRTIPH